MIISADVDFFVEDCATCGTLFAMTVAFKDDRLESGKSFSCPNGHSMHYANSVQRQLKEARDALTRERAQHDQTRADRDHTEHRLRSTKGVVTRIKNRVGKGVCPCCHRSFHNLARHMTNKHPTWGEPQ
jgi:hypothetical protein